MMTTPVIEIQNPPAKTIREKNERLHVRALQRHPQFAQIVKRIVAGQSAQSVARWCEESSREKGMQNFSFFTWRLYISTLRQRIKVTFKTSEIERPVPTPELVEALVDQVRRDNDIPVGEEKPDLKPNMARIWSSVKKAIREVDSEMIFKCAFLIQGDRVEKLIKFEEANDKLDKNGYKEILALKDIGDALRKFEVGEQVLRGGKSYNYGGEYSRKSPEAHVATSQAPATDSNTNSIVARVSRLDIVDRNLLVAATNRVIDMIGLEIDIANAQTSGVETHEGRPVPAEPSISAGTSVQDESASPANI